MQYFKHAFVPALFSGLLVASMPILADHDLEGRITKLDSGNRTLVVNDILIHTDERTHYGDGLGSFADLKIGQRVEIDSGERDGRRVAREIELED
jgi:hypothetical protein